MPIGFYKHRNIIKLDNIIIYLYNYLDTYYLSFFNLSIEFTFHKVYYNE